MNCQAGCILALMLFPGFCLMESVNDPNLMNQFEAEQVKGMVMVNHVFHIVVAEKEEICLSICNLDKDCLSYNSGPSQQKEHWFYCELNDSDRYLSPQDFQPKEGFTYRGKKNPCLNNPCDGKAVCERDGSDKSQHICVCPKGFIGKYCEQDSKLTNQYEPEHVKGMVIVNHGIHLLFAENEELCRFMCTLNKDCLSYNFGPAEEKQWIDCELNDSDRYLSPQDLQPKEGFAYRGKKVVAAERSKQQAISQDGKEHSNPCLPNPCKGPKDICERRGNDESQYDCVCSKCFPGKDCGSGALGMEDKSIPNIAITASSTHEGLDHRYLPSEGRLRNTRDVNVRERSGCWAPKYKSNSYFQVDLSKVMLVSGIATQGNQWTVINEYVTTYSVAYSLDGTNWEDYKEENSLKVFNGNTEGTSIVTNSFSREIKARYIRVLPLSWEKWPSLRVEFYGCSL